MDGTLLGLSPAGAARLFLLAVTPVALWVCWTDLKYMKIRNRAGWALVAIFAVAGLAALPPEVWAWRWLNLVVVFAAGLFLHLAAGVGAGDVKFAAAAAPFVAPAHAPMILPIFSAFLLGAFVAHRALRAIPAVRRLAPDWESWRRPDFPMGLAIAGTLVAYLALTGWPGLYGAVLNRM